MIKSTVSLVRTTGILPWAVVSGEVVLAEFATKREARDFLRLARAAERVANGYLKGVEAAGRTACDSRCTSAHGPVCSCACMGQNHQADLRS